MQGITRTLVYLACLQFAFGTSPSGLTCDCGRVNQLQGRIVGGSKAPMNKYPMVAMLEFLLTKVPFCGGTIITPRHVLTAAHCPSKISFFMRVKVGVHFWKTTGNMYKVKQTIIHEDYNQKTVVHDIAIVVTKERMFFNRNVGPACLPNRKLSLAGDEVQLLGWGQMSYNGPRSNVLQEATLRVMTPHECRSVWPLIFKDTMLCSYAQNKGTCKGDSGGPLLWQDPETNRYILMGITSGGDKCEGLKPSISTDVSAHIGWINEKVANSKVVPVEMICTKK